MKKITFFILTSIVSFVLGCLVERKSEVEVKTKAMNAASQYLDSVFQVKNNLDNILYVEKNYSKEIERPFTISNKNGYIPDAKTATRIAVSVWSSIYGEYLHNKKCPLEVYLKDDSIWIVKGSLMPNAEGGTPYIEICKQTGTIYKVNKEK